MRLALTTAPAALPLSLEEVKSHLRQDHADDDGLIAALIKAAVEHIDGRAGWLGRALMPQSWTQFLDAWPDGDDPIRLPLPPLRAVTHVKYRDGAGALQTLSPSVYEIDADSIPGFIRLAYNQSWPAPRGHFDDIEIRFDAGYADAGAIPAPIRQGLLLLIGHLYENRGGGSEAKIELPWAVNALLQPYRVSWL